MCLWARTEHESVALSVASEDPNEWTVSRFDGVFLGDREMDYASETWSDTLERWGYDFDSR